MQEKEKFIDFCPPLLYSLASVCRGGESPEMIPIEPDLADTSVGKCNETFLFLSSLGHLFPPVSYELLQRTPVTGKEVLHVDLL